MFLWGCSIHEMAPFGRFLGPFSPKYWLDSPKILTRASLSLEKDSLWTIFRIISLSGKGTYPKFTVLVYFWAEFNPRKSRILPKTKMSPKYASSGLSNSISARSYKKPRILIQLIKKNFFFGPIMGLNCHLVPAQRVNTNSHLAWNRTIHPWFMDPQVFGYLPF